MKGAKTHITSHERLQLIGLLTLAAQHNQALKDIERAAYTLTGEFDTTGHTSDAVYSDYQVDDLLSRLDITVHDPDDRSTGNSPTPGGLAETHDGD